MKRTVLIFMLILFTSAQMFTVCADSEFAPYNSYIYNAQEDPVYVPNAYLPMKTMTGQSLGAGPFSAPEDMFTGLDGRIYVMDTGNNRIVILNNDFSLNKVLNEFSYNGAVEQLNNAVGLFVDKNGLLYICDTGNRRILVSDENGGIKRVIVKPDKAEFPQDMAFEPEKLVADKKGSIYVICKNIYQGAVVFGPQGEFEGYFGATKVQSSLQIISQQIFKKFMTKEQKSKLAKFVPTEFENLTIQNDFIYTVAYESASGGAERQNAIRCLNPSGINIANNDTPFGDIDTYYDSATKSMVYSTFRDIYVDPNGYIYALDGTVGKLFVYDNTFQLLFVLGSSGDQHGTFRYPTAVEMIGEKLLVLDRGKNYICVLEPTDFFKTVVSANNLFNAGMYDKALESWNKVLKQCANYSVAYDGVARAQFNSGDYAGAMEYFKKANDKEGYSEAFKYFRLAWLENSFTIVVTVLFVLVLLLVLAKRLVLPKLRPKLAGVVHSIPCEIRRKVKTPFVCMVHPFAGFEDMRENNQASYPVSFTILGIWVLISLLKMELSGFIFNGNSAEQINIGAVLLENIGVFAIWVISSMALRTFLGGRARFRDVCSATSAILLPLCLFTLVEIIVSRVLTADESAFLGWISAAGLIWAALMLVAGIKGINEYELGKTIGAILLTALFACLIVFLFILFFSSLQQVFVLFASIFTEFKYRIL